MTNEEAIEVLKNDIEICTIQQKQACDMAIKALEQTRWIPCSEGLPEKDGEYLVYGKVVDENEDNHIFIGLYDEGSEGFGWWQDYYDNRTLGFLDSDFTEYASVVAWMPLPTPYIAESENKE